jgi:hypothetical protein
MRLRPTTAASRRKDDLSKVFVQMMHSVVEPEKAIDLVPKISEYANSQNRVNAADFFANTPYHIFMEKQSGSVFAPSPDGAGKFLAGTVSKGCGRQQGEPARR